MILTNLIEKRKQLFDLPMHQDQLEYWGPINHQFSSSFLTMGNSFLQRFFADKSVRVIKSIFSSFVEMVQNVAEYNELEFSKNLPQSFVRLKIEEHLVVIQTSNMIKSKDFESVKTRFENLFSWNEEELSNQHKNVLISGGSLGLIMLKRLKNATFSYHLEKEDIDKNWLSLELKIDYGSTEN